MSESSLNATRHFHVGVLVPSSNTQLEPAVQGILGRFNAKNGNSIHLYAHYTRIRVTQISNDENSAAQFDIEKMLQAASLLVDAGVHAIAWAGTSAGWLGTQTDQTLCNAITERFNIPATTTTLSLLEYMHTHSDKKMLLVTPFVQEINNSIRTNFAAEGIKIADDRCLSITENTMIGQVADQQIEKMAYDVVKHNPDVKTVAVVCTNVFAGDCASKWELNRDITVVDSIVITIWGLLGKIGTRVSGGSETDVQRGMLSIGLGNIFKAMKINSDGGYPSK